MAMRLALKYCEDHPEVKKIHMFSDSAPAIINITRSSAHPTQPLSLLYIEAANSFLTDASHRIVIQWVPGHSDIDINDHADCLAQRGCEEDHKIIPVSISYHSERKSKMTLRAWRRELRECPMTGAFGEVTKKPPTTKPDKVFYQLGKQPEVFGRLTQTRTMHGFNTAYYARFNLRPEQTCVCGLPMPPDPIQVRDHVLHSCNQYDEQRHVLTESSRHHHATILLGTEKGLLATAKFLLTSGAFTTNGRPYEPPTIPPMPSLDINDPP